MTIQFYKIEATGNDFIVLDNRTQIVDANDKGFWEKLCARRTGIGADGVLLVEKSQKSECDFRMRYLNADGGEVSMCGNGARAISWFAHTVLKIKKTPIYKFETQNGIYESQVDEQNNSVKLQMTELYDVDKINLDGLGSYPHKLYLNTGVPHCVFEIANNQDIDQFPVVSEGRKIRYDARFPNGTNANFFQVISPGHIKVRTYERGVEDETLSCGTGITACAYAYKSFFGECEEVKISAQGGELKVIFDQHSKSTYLCGPARIVFTGAISHLN